VLTTTDLVTSTAQCAADAAAGTDLGFPEPVADSAGLGEVAGATPAEPVTHAVTGSESAAALPSPGAAPPPQAVSGPSAEVHRQRLRCGRGQPRRPRFGRREPDWQLLERRLEQDIRREAAAFAEQQRVVNLPLSAAAELLDVSARTLRQWRYESRRLVPEPRLLGRPHARCTPDQAEAAIAWLHGHGPWVGVPTLRVALPQAPRAELRDLLAVYRHLWSQQHPRVVHVLHWLRAGSVWAMDFTKTALRIDGHYAHIFTVRDLASGRQLCWQAAGDQTEALVVDELQLLFTIYGAPLVLKSDNGSAFRAGRCKNFLQRWEVWPLYSPPGCPNYNGAVEASIGSLKRRTEFVAGRHGHTEGWMSADLDEALALANHEVRATGQSPQGRWDARRAPTTDERDAFTALVCGLEEQARAKAGIAPETELDHYDQAALHRGVLQEALLERGYLSMTRRRIPQRFYGQKAANIW
jgi:hypothetical protein